MNRLIMFALAISVYALPHGMVTAQQPAQEPHLSGTVTLSGAWAIYPTAVAWAQAFQQQHPKVRVNVSAGGAGKGAADVIARLVDIGMVSREPDPAELNKGITPIYVLHDAVFPVVSEKNPVLQELLRTGVTLQTWIGIYISGDITMWDQVVGRSSAKPIHVYTRSDSGGAAASWAKYLGGKQQEDLKGIGIYGDPGLLEAARRDPVSIGYANFSYVFSREGPVIPGTRVVPIDANENGLADLDERYETRDAAAEAIASGRYPAARKNYFFVMGPPSELVKAFIGFALSDEGTEIVKTVGASLPVPVTERQRVLDSFRAQ